METSEYARRREQAAVAERMSVDARSRRESPPKKARLIPAAAREKSSERPQSRASVALPQERYPQPQLRQLEQRAEPLDWVPCGPSGAESTTWAPPQSRSECWQSTLRRIWNLMFATSYVADLADIACFTNWLVKTPHHCHVILCQSTHSAVAEWLMQCTREASGREQQELLRQKQVVFVTPRVFIVLGKQRVELKDLKQVFNCDSMIFAVAEITIHERSATCMHGRSTALAVGVVHVLPQLRKMPEWLMTKMYDSVYSYRVRCFTGTFGLDAKQMASFAQKFPMATMRPVCQMWRGAGPDGQSTDVFPSYTLLLGDSSNTTITGELLESAVAVRNNWVSTMYPYDEIMPYWRRMSRAQLEQSAAYDTDWGHVKVKPVATDRWIPHVHQVVFWCGTAQQGATARIEMKVARNRLQKRSGNG